MDKLLIVSYNGGFYIEFAPLFAKHKITVKLAMTIQDALDMLSKDDYFVIVVDITYLDNINIIKVLRQSSSIPIITYSKEYNLDNKVKLLQDGADEYFVDNGSDGIEDIYASAKALRRRYHEYGEQKKKPLNIITLCDMIICLNTRRVFINNGDIGLNRKEFDIFMYLVKNKHKALTYEQIFNEIWGGTFQRKHINAVRCQMYRLAAKINTPPPPHDYIINIKDYGYRINPDLFANKEDKLFIKHEAEKRLPLILVVGYEGEELVRIEQEAVARDVLCQKADSIYDTLNMLTTDEYTLVMINGDKNGYLLSITLVREMTLAPILVTTNGYDINKKIAVIDNGADGYMQISKHNEDSHETASVLIRRYREYNNREKVAMPFISNGDILLDLNSRKTTVSGQEVQLTRKEFDILKFILNQKGDIVTYEQICEHAWGDKYEYGTYKPLMRMIYKLKEKIRISDKTPDYIMNVRGFGYRLNTEIDH